MNSFPILESLTIANMALDETDLYMEHPHIHKVWIAGITTVHKLVLSMPNLQQLYISDSRIE